MTTPFRPMLAGKADLTKIKFPVIASPKIDGIRATIHNLVDSNQAGVYSRSMKLIPNAHLQSCFINILSLIGLDGELTVGPANAQDLMQVTTSAVMSKEDEPDFTFWVFDDWSCSGRSYKDRYADLCNYASTWNSRIKLLPCEFIENQNQLDEYENRNLAIGYEGVMIRDPNGLYKQGRSTVKEGGLLKLKRFVDDEAAVIGFEEKMTNNNASFLSPTGYTARSSSKEGQQGADTLGALICKRPDGVVFNIGTGFTDDLRASIWRNRHSIMACPHQPIVTYKHFAASGVKEAPRFAVFKSFRNIIDL